MHNPPSSYEQSKGHTAPIHVGKKEEAPNQLWLRSGLLFLTLALVFSAAYAQSPLYTSNQNQYFLHGLANAGYGNLGSDWLANTLDPTPLFSLLVEWTYRLFHQYSLFYGIYAILLGLYAWAVIQIVGQVWEIQPGSSTWWVFLAGFITMHSAGLRFALSRLIGPNWTYLFEDGVADQRLLGPVLQPSAFGVLLVVSIALYLNGRPILAVLAAVLAASIHPTYLLAAASLTGGYILATWVEDRRTGQLFSRSVRSSAVTGAAALAAVMPILLYVYTHFGDTPAATTQQARQILVGYRIPHHALITWWFDVTAVVKVFLVSAALFLLWRERRSHRLLPVLFVPVVVATSLTILQAVTGNIPLALIFPWRLSVFLVPLASSLLLARLAWGLSRSSFFSRHIVQLWMTYLSIGVTILAVLVGLVRFGLDLQRKRNSPERPVMMYVSKNREAQAIYLTPIKMQDFRLATGAPVYVEFKSIPYQDGDVLEWYRRVRLADEFFKIPSCSQLTSFANEGVTHLVLPKEKAGDWICPGWAEQYTDDQFLLLQAPRP